MNNKMVIAMAILALNGDKLLNSEKDILENFRMGELNEKSLERGIEILMRSKKYMKSDEKLVVNKAESMLDLIRGIKKLSGVNEVREMEDSDFFRSMDTKDRRNMMIKEIIEVFPDNKKESITKIMDMKKKMELLKDLIQSEAMGDMKNMNLLQNLISSDEE
ncbi:hypothetical protein [Tepidibacter hydrothermalis]|uniref:Tellurite resistance protein TerB n=1 Tax=Tepidibacter hydrothermalis TaxID=3036126 RepID=A0ABY8EK19_9FIRM|nr:hypothetical protein [Tepidibacter hydrothermalis]WFD11383.1 hypothetical protein P4S50_04705 [Tepidibacter hydrothermalis]